jgi:hypothetical protein
MPPMRYLAAILALAACGGGAASPDASAVDSELAIDAERPDAEPCAGDACWIEGYLREVVAKLAGADDLAPGVRLTARASIAERDATRTYLLAELTRLGLAPELHDYGSGANVLARLGGDGPVVVLGAHFDGVPQGPAAADDATGVALVLAAARWFVDRPALDRPFVFILFDQEEVGLIGSYRYAEKLVADAAEVHSVHVFDMISWDGDRDGAIELWSPSPALATLYRTHGEALGVPVAAFPFEFSDHQSFLARGFTATGIGEEFNGGDHTPHYHQATDTYDQIDFAYLTSITHLALAAVEDAASD